jgi:hypothetical protein
VKDGLVVGLRLHGDLQGELAGALGLKPGDVLLKINGVPLDDSKRLLESREVMFGAKSTTIQYRRDGEEQASVRGLAGADGRRRSPDLRRQHADPNEMLLDASYDEWGKVSSLRRAPAHTIVKAGDEHPVRWLRGYPDHTDEV